MVDAIEIAARVRSGAVTATEVLEQHLAAIASREHEIHAFNLVMTDQARVRAEEVDAIVEAGSDPGPLAGVPIALKDNMCTARGADHVLVEDPRRVEASVRRDGCRQASSGRCSGHWQNQPR